jgi:hypothetical protein
MQTKPEPIKQLEQQQPPKTQTMTAQHIQLVATAGLRES